MRSMLISAGWSRGNVNPYPPICKFLYLVKSRVVFYLFFEIGADNAIVLTLKRENTCSDMTFGYS